jgi:hypothetical protein
MRSRERSLSQRLCDLCPSPRCAVLGIRTVDLLADADGSVLPDFLEGALDGSSALGGLANEGGVELQIETQTESRTQFEIGGRTHDSIEDVPAPLRDILVRGFPDLAAQAAQGSVAPRLEQPAASRPQPQPQRGRPKLERQPPAAVVTDLDRRWAAQRSASRSGRLLKVALTVAAVVGLALLLSRLF